MADARLSIIGEFKDGISQKLGGIEGKVKSFKSSMAGIATSLGGLFAGGALVKGIVETNMEFDKLEAQISTFTGSSEEAASAMKMIQDVTSNTPFQLNEVTTAFTRMKALGLNPTKEALMAFGDVAAGTGKSILQFTEAVADAAVGEFERLKEFGIKASAQGDQVAFTFKGVTTTVAKNSQEIQKYLTELGQNNFGGAMAKQMDTMAGAWSNAKDQFALLARAIGEAGLNDLLKSIAQAMGNAARAILDNMDVIKGTWANVVSYVSVGIEDIRYAFAQMGNYMQLIWAHVFDALTSVWNGFIQTIESGVNTLAAVIPGMEEINLQSQKFADTSEAVSAAIEKEARYHEQVVQRLEASRQQKIADIQATKQQADAVKDYSEYEQASAAAIAQSTAATESNTKAKKEQLTVYEQLIKNIEAERVTTEQSWDAMEKLDEAFIAGTISSEEYADALKVLEKNLLDVDTASKKTEKTTKKVETVFSRAMDRIKDNRKEVMESKDAQILLTQAYERGEITLYEYNEEMKRLNDTLDQSNSELTNLENSFGNFFDALITGSGDARSALRQLTSTLVDYIFNSQQAVAPSGGSSGGFLSGIGDFVSSAASGISDFVGGLFRAEGGPVFANNPYIVGERGPELFVPSTNGGIISNDKLGGGSNVTFNISALDGADVMRVLTQNRREIAELVSGTARTYGL